MSHRPPSSAPLKQAAIALLLAGAAFMIWRAVRSGSSAGERGFFYDESAARIFTGPRTAPPPIRGTDGPELDGFRAVVISTTGKPTDSSSWQIAYLEKFSPELQQKTLAAQASGEALTLGRIEAQQHRFVRRLQDTTWHRMDSPEAETILTGWATPGPSGITPVVCTP